MTDAETIAALRAELEQQRKQVGHLFSENCDLQRRVDRLQRMEGVLWTLCELTGDVYDRKRSSEKTSLK